MERQAGLVKDTYDYAQLARSSSASVPDEEETDEISGDSGDETEDNLFNLSSVTGSARPEVTTTQTKSQAGAPSGVRVLSIPITGGRTALLNIPIDVSEDDFKFLQTYLRLMKDAIVTGRVSDTDAGSDTALSET